jgi:hypothetical protein
MLESQLPVWPRPYFKPSELSTKILFVCFGRAPLAALELDRARFGLPTFALEGRVELHEHRRAASREWFEAWWGASFGVIAERDLAEDLALLTTSDVCVTLRVELPDQPDLAGLQTVWGLSRWLCARGASVVLDVHAFRFRTRAELEAMSFEESDVQREVKIVLETDPTQDGLHLLHTRGLCKMARPELMCFVRPEDASVLERFVNQIARTLMEGAAAAQIRLRIADGLELVTTPLTDRSVMESVGLQSAVLLARSDGAPLAGISRLLPAP